MRQKIINFYMIHLKQLQKKTQSKKRKMHMYTF